MSPLPGGRQHCVIPYGTWVPVSGEACCELLYSVYLTIYVASEVSMRCEVIATQFSVAETNQTRQSDLFRSDLSQPQWTGSLNSALSSDEMRSGKICDEWKRSFILPPLRCRHRRMHVGLFTRLFIFREKMTVKTCSRTVCPFTELVKSLQN